MPNDRPGIASSIPVILDTLKQLYRAKGWRYRDVAEALGISEVTVKRYMSGHGLTLELLEQLCGVVDLAVFDLLDLARRGQGSTAGDLSLEQEEALAKDTFLSVFFFLLMRGWLPNELKEEFGLADWEVNKYLTKLDSLELIRLYPMNKVKFTKKPARVKPGGPLMRSFDTKVRREFLNFSAADPELPWMFSYHRLSPASVAHVCEHMNKLMNVISQLAENDRVLPKSAASWQGVMFLMRPVDIGKWRDKQDVPR